MIYLFLLSLVKIKESFMVKFFPAHLYSTHFLQGYSRKGADHQIAGTKKERVRRFRQTPSKPDLSFDQAVCLIRNV